MKKYFELILTAHNKFWNREHLDSLLIGLIFFGAALVIQKIADVYVANIHGIAVNDVLLNNLPSVDIDGLVILLTLFVTFLTVFLFLCRPRDINFAIKSLALFIITRSFFISLTHLGSNPHELQFSPNSVGYWLYNFLYNTHGDFFFSGHTGMPFLTALILWKEPRWRHFFIFMSCVMGVCVLLAHIHYSIDVFAAPFMVYSIFSLSKKFFARDYAQTLVVNN